MECLLQLNFAEMENRVVIRNVIILFLFFGREALFVHPFSIYVRSLSI